MKKLNLADLFYDFAFDNDTSDQINDFVETQGANQPIPCRPDLRKWAEETAARFEVVRPGLYRKIN